MSVNVIPDAHAPAVAVELPILRPLPDYDIEEVDAQIPREVDGILVTQGFKDLIDDVRSALDALLETAGLELVQLTGAICPDTGVFHPGLWLVVRETGADAHRPASQKAQQAASTVAEEVRRRFELS